MWSTKNGEPSIGYLGGICGMAEHSKDVVN